RIAAAAVVARAAPRVAIAATGRAVEAAPVTPQGSTAPLARRLDGGDGARLRRLVARELVEQARDRALGRRELDELLRHRHQPGAARHLLGVLVARLVPLDGCLLVGAERRDEPL